MRSIAVTKTQQFLKMRIVPTNSLHVSVASWNVLADSYAYSQLIKTPCEDLIPTHIEWNNRKQKIAESISNCGADILCFQEVDHYVDFYEPLLGKLGYKSVYLQRFKRKDGCLIAFDSEKYQLHGIDEVQFDDIADFMDTDSAKSNMKRSNVALIAIMSSIENPVKKFVSSTAHMYWNPRRPEVKSLQTKYLVSRIDSYMTTEGLSASTPVFMAGDFNSVPFSEPYQLLVNGFDSSLLKKGTIGLKNIAGALYGPKTKFLCDRNLTRLCRWMRVLGIDVALVADNNNETSNECTSTAAVERTSPKVYKKNKQSFDHIFGRARDEQRVILTTSKTMRERAMCPPSFFISTKNLEAALIDVCKEYGLSLNQEKFLTVCGKCGGEIEACSHTDPRVTQNPAVPPLDRDIFVCKDCSQPYWWNERENSSPARAMKIADKLFNAVARNQTVTSNQDRIEKELKSDEFSTPNVIENKNDKVVSFELSERITIAVQNTEIREGALDSFDKSDCTKVKKNLPSPFQDQSHLTQLFNKRDKTIKSHDSSQIMKINSSSKEENFSNTVTKIKSIEDDSEILNNLDFIDIDETEVGNLLNKMSLTDDASVKGNVLKKSTDSRIFTSAYASVHDGKEPEATNWSYDFKE